MDLKQSTANLREAANKLSENIEMMMSVIEEIKNELEDLKIKYDAASDFTFPQFCELVANNDIITLKKRFSNNPKN